jgi:hypothetical protein
MGNILVDAGKIVAIID